MWGTGVDFLVASVAFEFELLTRRQWVHILGVRVPILSPEDVILMKLYSGRPIDWSDAKAVQVRQGSKLDRTYIEGWARQLEIQRGRGHVIDRWKKLLKMEYRA